MPVIPAPREHLEAALAAIDEHQAHHRARADHHLAEINALAALRTQYETVLSGARDHVFHEPTQVAAITVVGATSDNPESSFAEVLTTMSGRIPQQ